VAGFEIEIDDFEDDEDFIFYIKSPVHLIVQGDIGDADEDGTLELGPDNPRVFDTIDPDYGDDEDDEAEEDGEYGDGDDDNEICLVMFTDEHLAERWMEMREHSERDRSEAHIATIETADSLRTILSACSAVAVDPDFQSRMCRCVVDSDELLELLTEYEE
jgi:hypothetical protein